MFTFRLAKPAGLPLTCAAALLAAGLGSPLLRAAPTPAATASPAAADAPLDAADLAALRPHVNEKVKVRGTPTNSGHSKAGNVGYLNFAGAHQGVALVFFFKSGETGALASEDDLKQYVGKSIVVTGQLTEYKGDLQIKVESPDQIKVAP
ncbi:MAG: hypothetical protein INR65_18755 [Gluconacetobacter diazotrophicus]|nr:hypothetical protein [Gluconacetobacter diazotrophicus]